MISTAFIRKLIADELYDTLFFVSGEVPIKTRSKSSTVLEVPRIKVEIINGRKMYMNGTQYRFSGEVRQEIQREFAI